MGDVRKVLAAERLKLAKRRSTIVVPAIVVAMSAALFLALSFAARRSWIGVPSAFYLTAASMTWVTNIVAVCSIIITSFHISREFDVGTVKSTWVRPISRQSWFAGKVLSAWIMTGALFLAAMAVVIALASVRFGFVDLMEKDFLIHTAQSLWLKLAVTMLLVLLSLCAVSTVMAAIAVHCNHPGAAIAAGIGLALLCAVLGFFPSASPFLLSTALTLPVEQFASMSKGIPTPLSWADLAWRVPACAASWFILASAAGSVGIRKKEINF